MNLCNDPYCTIKSVEACKKLKCHAYRICLNCDNYEDLDSDYYECKVKEKVYYENLHGI